MKNERVYGSKSQTEEHHQICVLQTEIAVYALEGSPLRHSKHHISLYVDANGG